MLLLGLVEIVMSCANYKWKPMLASFSFLKRTWVLILKLKYFWKVLQVCIRAQVFIFLSRMISVLGHFCQFKNFQIWFQNWVYSPSRLEIE
jgi:hypothetical protein